MIKYIKVINRKTGKVFERIIDTSNIICVIPMMKASESLEKETLHFHFTFNDGSSISFDSFNRVPFEHLAYFLANTESVRLIVD